MKALESSTEIEGQDINLNMVRWMPILQGRSVHTGLNNKRNWVLSKHSNPDATVSLSRSEGPRIIALLEEPIGEIRNLLNLSSDVNLEACCPFPYCEVVIVGLKSNSNYWISLALLWRQELQLSEDIAICQIEIKNSAFLPAETKNSARRILHNKT